MKRALLLPVLIFSLPCVLAAQPAPNYVNDAVLISPPTVPPQIDAVNFINHNVFSITLTNPTYNPQLFDFSDTLNYTNSFTGFLFASPGIQMDWAPATSGQRRMASTIYNSGTLNVGASSNALATTESGVFVLASLPELLCSATNIANPGVIHMGFESLCSLHGKGIDLSRGTITSDTTGLSTLGNFKFNRSSTFDNYWGMSTNNIVPLGEVEGVFPPVSPGLTVATNRLYQTLLPQLVLTNAQTFLSDVTVGSNRFVRCVFLSNSNSSIMPQVFFDTGDIAVRWTWFYTNSQGVITNNLSLDDSFQVRTNFYLVVDGFAGTRLTYIPVNFSFLPDTALGVNPSPPTSIPPGTFDGQLHTNQYAAYQLLVLPISEPIGDIAGQDITNLPGRVEIVAENLLDLTHSQVSSLNYLLLQATNHFTGSALAQIASPYTDIYLRSTNGTLSSTNLLKPVIQNAEGVISLDAIRWTNVVGGFTNNYHVLYVDTELSPISMPRIQTLSLKAVSGTDEAASTNSIIISDILNVTKSISLQASRVTLTTNGPGASTPFGALNLLSDNIVWSTATPRLQYLTNNGFINTMNAVFFGGARTSPYYTSNYNEPYQVFANTGGVTNQGSLIWASTFLNSGVFSLGFGSFDLEEGQTTILTNGAIFAPNGDFRVGTGSLLISNHFLQAGGALNFAVTNYLDDGSLSNNVSAVSNKNVWLSGHGITLTTLPPRASLLATTVTNTDTSFFNIPNIWAGNDLGCSPAGYTNNAALGRLILDGQDPGSLFTFSPAGNNNAIYVDYLEFRDSIATNRDSSGNYLGIQIDPGMKIYYAQAVATGGSLPNSISIAEKLNGKNGGGFCWVSNYAGFYSGTNFLYPDGTYHYLNTALVQSCDIDSNGNGIVNCLDPAPIYIPSGMELKVAYTGSPVRAAVVSWNTYPHSSNVIFSASSPGGPNWQVVTNFMSGSMGGRVAITNQVGTNGMKFYKALVVTP
jgi:hypothetical protein